MIILIALGALFIVSMLNNAVKNVTGFDALGTWMSSNPQVFGYVLVAFLVLSIFLYFKFTRKK